MQENFETLSFAIKKYLDCDLQELKLLGSGANGKVYHCKLSSNPFEIALKITNYSDMLLKEVNTINFINDRVDIKLPKIYFYHIADEQINFNLIGMSYINGVAPNKINWFFKGKKRQIFCEQAIDNFLKLQQVTNDTYGAIDGDQYDNWIHYYRPFAKARLDHIAPLVKKGEFPKQVYNVLQKAYDNLDIILQDVGKPTLTHGDYWIPNLLADKNSLELVGCVDPFNLMWAEREYEIFTMILFPKFKLYKLYKSRVNTSKMIDLKSRMYSLFSEVYWFELLGKGSFGFMEWVARKIKKEFKRHNI